MTLPASGWTALASGYRFRASGGAISTVVLRPDRITVRGGGASWGYTLDEPSQGRIAVRLTLGSSRPWCAEAPAKLGGNPPSTASSDRVGRFVAQPRTPAPVVCPPVP